MLYFLSQKKQTMACKNNMLYFHVKSIHGFVSAAIKYALLFSCGFMKEDEYCFT